MKSRPLLRLLASFLLVFFAVVQAEELSPENIQKFISTLRPLRALANDAPSGKLSDTFKTNVLENGFEKGIYSNLLRNLRTTDPELESEVKKVIKSNGFNTTEEWATIGDRVMAAYIAIALEGNADQLRQAMSIDPEVVKQMGPIMQRKVTQLQRVFVSSQQVPSSDKSAVQPFVNELESLAPSKSD